MYNIEYDTYELCHKPNPDLYESLELSLYMGVDMVAHFGLGMNIDPFFFINNPNFKAAVNGIIYIRGESKP